MSLLGSIYLVECLLRGVSHILHVLLDLKALHMLPLFFNALLIRLIPSLSLVIDHQGHIFLLRLRIFILFL